MNLQTNRNNGGIFYGWVILATSFLTTFISWGFYYSFGVFFQSLQTEFNANRADISLISSILIFTMYMMGLFYGWAIDKYDSRISEGIGGIATCAGLLLSSQATAVWQLYLSLGLLVGFGVSSTTVPLLSTLARWFAKMRGLVLGIVTAGAGAGMMIMAPLLQRLITSYGWRNTFVILGIASFAFFAISAVTIRGSPQQRGLLPYGTMEPGESQGTDRKPVIARPRPSRRRKKGRYHRQ
jgi:MFS family permease